ncbi:DUF2975 domain-containing protein [Candidatus Uhrbacteria bacterium]|nr:DUF2975 domain-containing protein [Candidatus Uhrbacteria bacterium]
MKRIQTIFLQVVIVTVGIMVFVGMIRFPMTEGRAANLDLFSIYWDSFVVYIYVGSVPFFVALYQAFTLLGYIGQNKTFSLNSVEALRTIKYCAIIQSGFIVMAGLYIRMFHAEGDDPAGFLAMCIITTFVSIIIATGAAILERIVQSAVDRKFGNDTI